MDALKIQIPSISENIRIVESFIDNIKEKFNVDDDLYGNIMVAVTESVNNAIKHGNKCDSSKNVILTADCDENALTITVEDQGKGFDYLNLPDPTAPENILKENGRGIFLMKNLADEVEFENGGNTVSLYFNK